MDCNEMPPALLSYAANEEELRTLQHTADILFCNHAHSGFATFDEALCCSNDYFDTNRLNTNFAALKRNAVRNTFSANTPANAATLLPDGLTLKQFARKPYLFTTASGNAPSHNLLTPARCMAQKLLALNLSLPDDSDDITWQARKGLMHKWRRYVCKIYQSIYVRNTDEERICRLRLELLLTYLECFRAKWHTEKLPEAAALDKVAWIVAWNTFVPAEVPANIFGDLFAACTEDCTTQTKVMKWESREPLKGSVMDFSEWLQTQKHIIRI